MIPFASDATSFKKSIIYNINEVNKEKLKEFVKAQIIFSNHYKNKLLSFSKEEREIQKTETENLYEELNNLENPSEESMNILATKMGFSSYEHLQVENQKLEQAKVEFIESGGFGNLNEEEINQEVIKLAEDEEMVVFLDRGPCKNPKGEIACDLIVLGALGMCLLKICTKTGPFAYFCAAMCTLTAVGGLLKCDDEYCK